MGPEIDVEENLGVKMKSSPYNANEIFAKELEEELMKFTTASDSPKSNRHVVEHTEEVRKNVDVEVDKVECKRLGDNKPVEAIYQEITESSNVDVEVDIMECKRPGDNKPVEAICQETTESSSSFDDSGSEDEGESEASSALCGGAELELDYDGFHDMLRMRRKKLTTHWRTYIQPLMWRCKWAEMQILRFESQAKKYDRSLSEYSKQKHIQLENSTSEGICARSIPFQRNNAKIEVLRRKKRKRTETTDLATYMSNHNLFSYYENRKCVTEGASLDKFKTPAKNTQKVNIRDELWVNDELLFLEPGDGDNPLEDILRKIMSLESQVVKMRSRVDKVMNENVGKFSYPEELSSPMPSSALMISPQNIASPSNSGKKPLENYFASQPVPEYDMGDLPVLENALQNLIPDVNGSRDLACFEGVSKNGDDEILIDNQRVKEEIDNFEGVNIQPIQKPLVVKDETGVAKGVTIQPIQKPLVIKDESDTSSNQVMAVPSTPKTRSIAKLTAPTRSRGRKGRRKGAARGRRRSSG